MLATAKSVERDGSLIGQRDAAHPVRLRGVLLPADVAALDVHDPVRKVDVPPPECKQLALPQPCERGHDEHRREIARGRSGHRVNVFDAEHVELVGAPHDDLLGILSHVHGHPALALRSPQDSVQQNHHLLHRPVRQFSAE